jgi:dTDP-glucose pyrophosphorylase
MKFNLKKITVYKKTTVKEAMIMLQESSKKVLLVADDKKKLIGVVNDGDIRRAILKNHSLKSKVFKIMNKKPITATHETSILLIKKLMVKNKIDVIPVLKNKKIIDAISLDEIVMTESEKTDVIINAGGLGKRLAPLTNKKHKTLLEIKNKPILFYIIQNFYNQGFKDFKLILNHKSNQIIRYVNKMNFNSTFDFFLEKKPLGTCGGLRLIEKKKLSENIILINCDIISGIDFVSLLSFHKNNAADITVVTSRKKIKLKYGSIESIGFNMISMDEKPEFEFMVNAGIYIINKSCIDFINRNKKLDMPDLLKVLKKQKRKIKIYPTNEYWFDIGSKEDLKSCSKFFDITKYK